ncbi:ABC transporter substrate-binding protein [Gammaproteobacteria bacterium]|nr:ABC transporter substrate-binding protein [Gammaproteobacteria bacterium]
MRCTRHLFLTLFFFLIAACSETEQVNYENISQQQSRGVSPEEIIIGSHTDLSGPVAIWGVGSINGARMRFEEVNAQGGVHGRKISFIVEDTQYQIPRAIQAANKLIHRDNIFAMLLALGTPPNNAVLTQQLTADVPNLFPLTGARSMVEPFHQLKFSQRGIYYDEIRAGLKFFAEKGNQRPCVIYQDTDYGQEILEGAKDQAAEMGLKIWETSAHKPTESEFTASILKLKNASCDVVFMGTIHRDTILILETARKLGIDAIFVGNNAAYAQVIADQKSGSGENYHAFVHMAKLYKEKDLSTPISEWWDRYEQRFGREPGTPAMEGYRAADLVVLSLEIAGEDLSLEKFIQAMESITDYQDLFGYKVSFSPEDHNGVSESVLSVVKDGKWETVATGLSY